MTLRGVHSCWSPSKATIDAESGALPTLGATQVLWTLVDPTAAFEIVHVGDKGDGAAAGGHVAEIQSGLAAATATRPNAPSFGLVFGAPGGEDENVSVIKTCLGEVPVFGGSSGDNFVSGEWEQISLSGPHSPAAAGHSGEIRHTATANGLVVVVAWTRCRIVTSLTSPYAATKHTGVVTKVVDVYT